MEILQHLSSVVDQFQTTATQVGSIVDVSSRGEGWNVTVSLPEKIEFTRTQLYWLWGLLHVAWGLGVHWISLGQINKYNANLAPDAPERIQPSEKLMMFLGRMGFGFEWKLLQTLSVGTVLLLSNVWFKLIGPVATYAVSPLIFGNTSDARNIFRSARESIGSSKLFSVSFVTKPQDIKASFDAEKMA